MKKKNYFLILIPLLFLASSFKSQSKDMIEGIWYNEEKTAKFEIYKARNKKYYGIIKWLKIPIDPDTNKPKLDKLNSDEEAKKTPLLGLKILKGFVFEKPGVWEDGTVYSPKEGKTYSCVIKMEANDPNTLFVRGYIMVSIFGKTTTWQRTELSMEEVEEMNKIYNIK